MLARMRLFLLMFGIAALLLAFMAIGLAGSDERSLRDVLGDDAVASRWIYDDPAAAIALAKQQRKPIFALFRCVP